MKPIRYTIAPAAPEAHLFTVTVTVDAPDPQGQRFSLPAWIPGSYMIREFARNIVRIEAMCGERAVRLTKLDKHTWQAAPCSGPLTVSYDVYAWDLSVRAAHLDPTHGFFNGTSVFLRVEGASRSAAWSTSSRPRAMPTAAGASPPHCARRVAACRAGWAPSATASAGTRPPTMTS